MTVKFVEVPNVSMFEGLVHGANRHAQNANIGGKPRHAFYVDVTEAAADAALYSMLRKKPHADIKAVGYSVTRAARGMTQPKEVPVFLSDNLAHIAIDSLKQDFCDLLRALCRSALATESNITLYYQKDMAFIRQKLFDWVYESRLELYCGKVDISSYAIEHTNIEASMLLSMVRNHDYIHHFASNFPDEIVIGSDVGCINVTKLLDTANLLAAQGRKVKICKGLHRKAFDLEMGTELPLRSL